MSRTRPRPTGITRSWRSTAVLVASLATSAGCYSYRNVAVSELKPEMNVRMQLTAVAVDRLRNSPNGERRLLDGFDLDGIVASTTSDSVVVSVATTSESDPAMKGASFRQPIALQLREVQQVELRSFDRRKTTWTTVVLSTLSAAAAIYAITHGGEASGSTPPNGGPNELRVPFFFRLSR